MFDPPAEGFRVPTQKSPGHLETSWSETPLTPSGSLRCTQVPGGCLVFQPHLDLFSSMIPLKARLFSTPATSSTPLEIQATNSPGPKVYLWQDAEQRSAPAEPPQARRFQELSLCGFISIYTQRSTCIYL